MTITTRLGTWAACAALAVLTGLPAAAQVVGIVTDQPGSLGYNAGQAVAKIANQEGGILARAQPLAGTRAYMPLINNGEFDFGFGNAVEVAYAYEGSHSFDDLPNPDLRLVGVMFPLRTGLMVTADSGIVTIEDVRDRSSEIRVASDYTASTIIADIISGGLANGDMTYDDLINVPVSNFVKGMEALGEGLVDLTLISLNSAGGKEVNAKLQNRGGIRYVSLDMSEEGQEKLRTYLPTASVIRLEANPDIPGLGEAANIIEFPWVMVASSHTSDEVVYDMVKTLAEHQDALAASFGPFRNMSVPTMAPVSSVPYHPGALRYYEEAGIAVDG
ncbi:MAG: TAXI family TRAP transporter solute-binding subunit [Maritimibacter sp.]|nr:TAXI family TRAP transporter solute-binding subunit [Maritimibacter sp.]